MPKKQKRNAVHRAVDQLIMEDHEVYVNQGIAMFMDKAVGVDMEAGSCMRWDSDRKRLKT